MILKIIKKILINLLFFYKIPLKLYFKYNIYISKKNYDQNYFENKQDEIFDSLNLNRTEGINNLNFIKKKFDLYSNANTGMSSEHEVLFSSISIKKKSEILNILEIGTYDGYNSLLLSKLFSKSKIDTIDLNENDADFINYYNRKDTVKEFVSKRNNHLSQDPKINFYELNSLNLLNHKKKYDLIWIDGAHGYPVVCIDIINSLNLLNNGGIIMCDDIHINLDQSSSDRMHHSIASYETLKELQKQNLLTFELIYKRLNFKNNFIKKKRKFVAIVFKV